MKTISYVGVGLVVALCIPLYSVSAQSLETRYLVTPHNRIARSALSANARNSFGESFTAELTPLQLRLAKVFGADIEAVDVLYISEPADAAIDARGGKKGPPSDPSPSPIYTATPTAVPVSPSDQTPWGVEAVYGDSVISQTSGGNGVRVAVLDTGVMSDHQDLSRRLEQCKDFTNKRFAVVNNQCTDNNGHGTHVAGIVMADAGVQHTGIYGIAPEAKLFAYKVCGNNGSCYSDDIANAIYVATDQGAHVISMSLGSDSASSLVHDAVTYAYAHGVLIVAAAGNDGPFDASIDYPAAFPEVIAVGALDATLSVANWSSRGINSATTPNVIEDKDIEFAAPGLSIESTWNDGAYKVISGTSMATPFISGLAAKLWSQNLSQSAQTIRTQLKALTLDVQGVGEDNESGYGMPQL